MGQALAQVHIEVGERFVQQQQARLGRQRARQRHALLLSARKLVRKTPLGTTQAHQIQHLGLPRGTLGARQAVDAEADVLAHIEMRKQRVILKHHADTPLLGRHRAPDLADHVVAEPDRARAHRLQPGHRAQQRGLAAARRADQHADLARAQPEGGAPHRRLRPPGVMHIELADFQEHAKHCR